MSEHKTFDLPIRVYYEDTDAGGIVYHSIYLNFMERARTEWLMARKINLQHYATYEQKMFVVRGLSVNYHASAYLCDDLVVKTAIAKISKTRILFDQKIYREEQRLVDGFVEVVCLNTETRKPLALPSIFFEKEI